MKKNLPISTTEKIAKAFEVSINKLFAKNNSRIK